jgi:RES domain-containing protein
VKQRAWRIVQRRHVDTAFDGEGARRHGGRWNHKGTPLIYAAPTRSLAILELLVNLHRPTILEDFVLIPIDFPEDALKKKRRANLPKDWRESPAPNSSKDIGTNWVKSRTSAILQVPSVILPEEKNFLLNPHHPEYKKIKIGKPDSITLDPRLLG